jgi:type III restriction enzyme
VGAGQRGFDPVEIADSIPENAQPAEGQLKRISISEEQDGYVVDETVASSSEALEFDHVYAVRIISDIVPNPFVGREIVGRLVDRLEARGFNRKKISRLSGLILGELRRGLERERARRAEARFRDDVAAGRIQFRLRVDGRNWRMPSEVETTEPENARKLLGRNGDVLQRSLFSPIYENELNNEEQDVAVYLDGDEALSWWHRNAARSQFSVQGWKRQKIYPDFIFAASKADGRSRLIVLETKGDHLDNLDTEYKRQVLDLMSENFAWDETPPSGTLELVQENGDTVECVLILMSDVPTKLPGYLASEP